MELGEPQDFRYNEVESTRWGLEAQGAHQWPQNPWPGGAPSSRSHAWSWFVSGSGMGFGQLERMSAENATEGRVQHELPPKGISGDAVGARLRIIRIAGQSWFR